MCNTHHEAGGARSHFREVSPPPVASCRLLSLFSSGRFMFLFSKCGHSYPSNCLRCLRRPSFPSLPMKQSALTDKLCRVRFPTNLRVAPETRAGTRPATRHFPPGPASGNGRLPVHARLHTHSTGDCACTKTLLVDSKQSVQRIMRLIKKLVILIYARKMLQIFFSVFDMYFLIFIVSAVGISGSLPFDILPNLH